MLFPTRIGPIEQAAGLLKFSLSIGRTPPRATRTIPSRLRAFA
jgi:hypothetical protein